MSAKTENASKTIAVITLITTILLCLFAGYSAYVSQNVAQIISKDYLFRMRPSLRSRVSSANPAEDGGLVIQISITNHGNTDISLHKTRVFLIDFVVFKESSRIEIIKEAEIEYETLYLPRESETTYNFNINEPAFQRVQNHQIAILSKTEFSDYREQVRTLNLVTIYGKLLNSLATYKSWFE